MKQQKQNYTTIDEYIKTAPEKAKLKLIELRKVIKETAPNAKEVISYQMPAFSLNGILVYFAARKNHIGFYPTSSGIEHFKSEFRNYQYSKGTVQFPIDQPLPIDLIKRIVTFRLEENLQKKQKK